MKRKVIVIGANSYIARNLIHYLKINPDNIIVGLYDCADEQLDGEGNYCKVSVLNKDDVSKINMNCDLIYMFVGKTGAANGFDDFDTFIDVNEKGLLNVLNEYRRQNSSAKIVFPSTRLIYKGSESPLNEDSDKEFKTVYAINKYSCEQYLKQYQDVYNTKYLIFRICVPYGTMIKDASSYGTAEFMLSKAKNNENISLYGDGSQRRTLTNIKDLCRVLYEGAINENCLNDVYNIGGENYSLNEMALLIAKKYGVKVEHKDWPELALKVESGSTVFDSSKLDSLLKINYDVKFCDWINEEC